MSIIRGGGNPGPFGIIPVCDPFRASSRPRHGNTLERADYQHRFRRYYQEKPLTDSISSLSFEISVLKYRARAENTNKISPDGGREGGGRGSEILSIPQ